MEGGEKMRDDLFVVKNLIQTFHDGFVGVAVSLLVPWWVLNEIYCSQSHFS